MTTPENLHINPIITGRMPVAEYAKLRNTVSGSEEAEAILKRFNSDGLPGDFAVLVLSTERVLVSPTDLTDVDTQVLGYVGLGPDNFGKRIASDEEAEAHGLAPFTSAIDTLSQRQANQLALAKSLGHSLRQALMSGYDPNTLQP